MFDIACVTTTQPNALITEITKILDRVPIKYRKVLPLRT